MFLYEFPTIMFHNQNNKVDYQVVVMYNLTAKQPRSYQAPKAEKAVKT